MPIYEYRCAACGHLLEAFQKITEEPLTTCPHCHKEALTKLVSASSFQLKGTGWYKTDFSNKGKPKEKENQEKSTTEADKTTKTEKSDTQSKSKTSDSSGSTEKS